MESGPAFAQISELAGEPISREQLQRLHDRYRWAAGYCRDADVLEVACGSGPGLGHLAGVAKSLVAGDLSEDILALARRHYGDRIDVRRLDAESLPFAEAAFDVVIICEALYLLPRPQRFLLEAQRVLRSGGRLLIVSANKDLPGFQPCLYSHDYFGVVELDRHLRALDFLPQFFGGTPLPVTPWRQRALRPLHPLAAALGVMPQTMRNKRFLRRLVFGPLLPMPAELQADEVPFQPPTPIPSDRADRQHKVIFCAAMRQ
jgi:SAM-dependent methyltransferase